MRRFTPKDQASDAVFDLRAVFQQPHTALAIESMPSLLRPAKGRFGLYDYEKVYSAVLKHASDIYDLRGIVFDGVVDPAFTAGIWVFLPPLPAGG